MIQKLILNTMMYGQQSEGSNQNLVLLNCVKENELPNFLQLNQMLWANLILSNWSVKYILFDQKTGLKRSWNEIVSLILLDWYKP